MKRIVQIELQKITPSPVFWVFTALYASIFMMTILLGSGFEFKIEVFRFDIKEYFNFPTVWNTYVWIAGWYNILLGVLVIALTGNEFSYRTFRKQVMDGLDRKDLIAGKLFIILLLAVSALVLVFLFSVASGLYYGRGIVTATVFQKTYFLASFFIQSITCMSMGMFFAIILKNIALAIVLFVLYIFPIEPIVRNLFNDEILYFFPSKVISMLTPRPGFLGTIPENIEMALPPEISQATHMAFHPEYWQTVTAGVIYCCIFIGLSYWIIKRRDL